MNISVYAPKPGCGASTVSRMLASTLARKSPVLLVELDFYFPSTALALGLHDEHRNLDRCLDDFNRMGAEHWRLADYVSQYRATNMFVLAPYGKKGFEYFPQENQEFIPALLHQAKSGFEHVILDAPALVDTVFCLDALSKSDLILCVLNDEYANALLYHHRMELFKEMNIGTEVELVANSTREKANPQQTLKKAVPGKEPGLMIPYTGKLRRTEKTGEVPVSKRLQKKMEQFMQEVNQKNGQ